MSESPALKATLKAGTDYSAPWLTIDGTTPDDLKAKLEHIAANGLPQALIDAANALHGAYNAKDALGSAPQQQDPWGGQQQAAPQFAQNQRQAPQQQVQSGNMQTGGGQRKFGGRPHPEGHSCEMCGKVLEYKETSGGKGVFRCPDWRWNSGNQNGHGQEWAS